MTTTSALPNAVPLSSAASARAYASLVLGLLGLLVCILLSPLAWYLGAAEVKDIRAGLAPAGGEPVATVGMILGVIGSVLLGLIALVLLAVAAVALIVLAIAL
jgi:hypothetical protein